MISKMKARSKGKVRMSRTSQSRTSQIIKRQNKTNRPKEYKSRKKRKRREKEGVFKVGGKMVREGRRERKAAR